MPTLPFHSYSIATAASGRLVNCQAELAPVEVPESGKAPLILTRTPGIRTVCSLGTGPGRGLHVMKGHLYSVSGTGFYKDFTNTSLGTIAGTERQYMANNGTQLSVIGNSTGYIYSGGLAAISDTDFVPGPSIYLGGYLLGIHPHTGQFASSDLFDFANFDGLDFATAEADPDDLITLAGDHKQALLIGEESSELWAIKSDPGAGFPFELIGANGVIEIGGAGPRAVIKQDQSVFWLANDRTLRRLSGNTPVRVSQHGAERKWRDYARVDDCEFSKYTVDGHLCVVLRFPTANATWVYDCTTKEMFELEGRRFQMWDVSDIASLNGVTYVQRASTGQIGILDPTCYTQWDETLRAEWTYQNIYGKGLPITLSRLELGIETGVGNEDVEDPHLTLQMSYDGGKSFTHTMPTRPIGKKGEYREHVHWDRCGYGNDIVPRISLAEAVPLKLWDTQFNVD